MVYRQEIVVSSRAHGDMHDLTEQVAGIVSDSRIREGTVNLFNIGSTAAGGTLADKIGGRTILKWVFPAVAVMAAFLACPMMSTSRSGQHRHGGILEPSYRGPIDGLDLGAVGAQEQSPRLERHRGRTPLVGTSLHYARKAGAGSFAGNEKNPTQNRGGS